MKEGWRAERWSQLIRCPDNKLKLQQPGRAEQRDERDTQRNGNDFIPSIHSVQITVFVWHMENTACCLYEFITAERSFSCRLRAPLKSGSHITVKQLHLVFKTTLHIFMKPQPLCTCVGVCSVPSNELLECIRSYSVHAGGGGREGRREGGRQNPTSVTQEQFPSGRASANAGPQFSAPHPAGHTPPAAKHAPIKQLHFHFY